MSDVRLPFALEPERAKRDGCDCPPWFERCVHFDDRIVGIVSQRAGYEPCACKDRTRIRQRQFAVIDIKAIQPCPSGKSGLRHIWPNDRLYLGDDYDAALAAFHEAEERLLRGEL